MLRHGHAEAQADGGDFERELDGRGRTEVARAARAVLEAVGTPDLALASAARRTQQTAAIFCEQAHDPMRGRADLERRTPGPPVLRLEPALYHASWREMLGVVQETDKDIGHLLVVGHNPGISELALHWANSLRRDGTFMGFSTAGWCSVVFESESWQTIAMPSDGLFVAAPN